VQRPLINELRTFWDYMVEASGRSHPLTGEPMNLEVCSSFYMDGVITYGISRSCSPRALLVTRESRTRQRL
jgi:hypothetical protein